MNFKHVLTKEIPLQASNDIVTLDSQCGSKTPSYHESLHLDHPGLADRVVHHSQAHKKEQQTLSFSKEWYLHMNTQQAVLPQCTML
jgi:hypothetical protein